MIPAEVLKKVRQIQIRTRRTVNDVLAGQYSSVFKGRGMEFDEVRAYQVGDDVRTIDWNVTARTGHPYVKRFVEERELTVILVVDVSASGAFGSTERLKSELAAELCALLAFSAIRNNDKVGLILFTDQVELFVPPKKGKRHVLRVIRELLYFEPARRGTDISMALDYLNRVARRHSVVFLVSDFIAGGYARHLTLANRRHDLVAVAVTDPRELTLPRIGLVELEDAETGEVTVIDTWSRRAVRRYAAAAHAQAEARRRLFARLGIDSIEINTGKPYVPELLKFFRMRERRL
ncbi:MAG: DUF58 domain-containing protein [Verrucomicrobia bacterium]|nr:DUF58 domain-containing protein [Verrucomicrobiota bacterium]